MVGVAWEERGQTTRDSTGLALPGGAWTLLTNGQEVGQQGMARSSKVQIASIWCGAHPGAPLAA